MPINTIKFEVFNIYKTAVFLELDLQPEDRMWIRGDAASKKKRVILFGVLLEIDFYVKFHKKLRSGLDILLRLPKITPGTVSDTLAQRGLLTLDVLICSFKRSCVTKTQK